MRAICLAVLLLIVGHEPSLGQDRLPAATITAVRQSCTGDCKDYDAVVFVHGIYGDETTFKNGNFDWPREFPQELGGRKIDVFRINYTTSMLAWLRRNIATFDDVVQTLYDSMYGSEDGQILSAPLNTSGYRSIGFVAHSLGGNLATAYLHTVKTWRGHNERSRYAYIVTLGTPVNGAQIANVALVAKRWLGMDDPLLSSLQRDNTFLRMLTYWKRAEISKAEHFGCRRVNLYVGLEGSFLLPGMSIVSHASALDALEGISVVSESFPAYDHSQLAKPASKEDPVYKWVSKNIETEMLRLSSSWRAPAAESNRLCEWILERRLI